MSGSSQATTPQIGSQRALSDSLSKDTRIRNRGVREARALALCYSARSASSAVESKHGEGGELNDPDHDRDQYTERT